MFEWPFNHTQLKIIFYEIKFDELIVMQAIKMNFIECKMSTTWIRVVIKTILRLALSVGLCYCLILTDFTNISIRISVIKNAEQQANTFNDTLNHTW